MTEASDYEAPFKCDFCQEWVTGGSLGLRQHLDHCPAKIERSLEGSAGLPNVMRRHGWGQE